MGNIEENHQTKYVETQKNDFEPQKISKQKQNKVPFGLPPLTKLDCKAIFHKISPLLLNDGSTPEPQYQPQPLVEIKQQGTQHKSLTLLQHALTSDLEKKGIIQVHWNLFTKIKQKSYLEEYIFVKQIGKGAYGQVIIAKTKFGSQKRAIKIIKQSVLLRGESLKQKIYAQIAIPIELDHPNIGKIYEVFEWKQSFGIVMQLCEGGDLFAHIKNQRKFTQVTVASLFKQIISGVHYMHRKKICHRDLKLENMLYDIESKQIKIIDFGTAVKINKEKPLEGMIGTMYYIAPEVISGQYDEICDVWSCGVILYIVLCGFPPFQGKNQKEIKDKILYSPVQFNHPIWNKRSSHAREIISKMLTKDPRKRITTQQILTCNWFQKILRESFVNNEISGQVMTNLKNFHFKNKLKAVVYTFIASQLYSNKDKENLLKVFKAMDRDGDGVIQRQQLIEAFHMVQSPQSDVQIQKILVLIDTNASGKIDFTQFLVAASNQQEMLKKKQLQAAFSYLDSDHSGYITIQEVKAFLDGSSQTQEQIKSIFKQVDQNGDGKISKNQFVALLIGHKQPFNMNQKQ